MRINGVEYNYKEIFEAWIAARNPSDDEKKLAERRYEVCLKCEFKKSIIKNHRWSEFCQKCGCPISKKIFTKMYNTCPIKKWEESDRGFIEPLVEKDKKTLF